MKVKERLVEYFYTASGKAPAKEWLNSIKDKLTQAILFKRIRQASLGNFGDSKSVGQGVLEMRIDFGPGYRIYYGIHKDDLILLLMGGSKRTQQNDIEKAQAFWTLWKDKNNG